MIPSGLVWAIFLLPVASFAIIALLVKPFVKPDSRISGYILIGALSLAVALACWTLMSVMNTPEHVLPVPDMTWVVIGSTSIHVGLLIDQLSALMLVVVTIVSLMVQIYSQGYMHGDAGYHRYFAWMSLFTASMLGLVMANNMVFMFVFWEMVGVCSYLLIGFWFHRPSAANAAKKAFIVTRIGDFGFLAGILILYANTGTFDTTTLHNLALTGALAGSTLTWAAIGIFGGAVGKSAQFPLHVWLPDAMEGPTPVSGLIHSATMVSAGVFMVARMFPLFINSAEAIMVVAVIGAFTAIFAASMGLVSNDIKRVLAYSTVSQLGYMMLGLGAVGLIIIHSGEKDITLVAAKAATAVGMFHLFNHAFFKALLFLGSGSVNHSTGTFDMRLMGGLRKAMPWTYATFLIGSLSLAGIWPLSGFWSKDEILAEALHAQPVLFVLAIITVFMTAFYMFRAIFLTFHGEYKGGAKEAAHGAHGAHGSHGHIHESPMVMIAPLVFLSILSIFSGFWNVGGGFNAYMGEGETTSFIAAMFAPFTHPLPMIALLVALAGIFLAYAMYIKNWISAEALGRASGPVYTLLSRKYYFDELYEDVIVKKVLLRGFFAFFRLFDAGFVDGIVNGAAATLRGGGAVIRRAESGQLQLYGLVIGAGFVVILLVFFIAR